MTLGGSMTGAGGLTGGIQVVVVGATGNVGTSVVEALAADAGVESIVGVARRAPDRLAPKTQWVSADIAEDDLVDVVRGADAVVHLAWLFQPTHDPATTWRTNVLGGIGVFEAVAEAGVPALVYASSVGAYMPRGDDVPVDESWPTHGWPQAAYTREKAYLERFLDRFEVDNPAIRLVRLRPAFSFKREAAGQQRRLFGGPLVPERLVRPGLMAVVPDVPGLRFQTVHTADVAEAYRLAVTRPVRGAFNLAADPVLDVPQLAEALHARVVRVPTPAARAALAALWRLHVVPASPDLFDAVLRLPVMDTTRARIELGWVPRYSGRDAVEAFLTGLRGGDGADTPPLAPSSVAGRMHEFGTGVGEEP